MKKSSNKDRRKELKRRVQESFKGRDTRKSTGGRGVFSLKDYEDVSFFTPAAKQKYNIDIIPWIMTTDGFPTEDREGSLSEGDAVFALIFAVHWGVGPEEVMVLCPKATFGEPCPICEELHDLRKAGEIDDDDYASMRAKWRAAYNVIDLDDEDEGIQIFHVSCPTFHDEMIDELKQEDEEVAYSLCDLEEGYTVVFRAVTKSAGHGRKYVGFKSFSFKKRKHSYDDDEMDRAYPLDAMMTIMGYDTLKQTLKGTPPDDDDGDSDDDDDDGKDNKRSRGQHKSKSGNKTHRQRRRDSNDDDDDDDGKGRKDDDNNDNDGNSECPYGHKFGTDCDSTDDCQDCESWDECSDKQDELEEEEKNEKRSSGNKGTRRMRRS